MLEKTSLIELPPELGGTRIRLLGMDDPDAARGMKLRFAVLDEYADMPPRVWPEIIRPALMDVRGGALFIGTPKGRNHFYDLVTKAIEDQKQAETEERDSMWAVFNYASTDNPLIHKDELKEMAREYTNGSEDLYDQEIAAKFVASSGQLFSQDQFKIVDKIPDEPMDTFMAVDLAGFATDPDRKNEVRKLDDTAMAMVSVDQKGNWYIREIKYGKWGPRETANQIVQTAHKYSIPSIGIEKGALMNAVQDYMHEYMGRYNRWFELVPLTHGNKAKFDRVQWALQGRAQKGQLHLLKAPWNAPFIDQCISFPSKYVHDDLVDAVAYIDQLVGEVMQIDVSWAETQTAFQPMDEAAGY